MNVRGADALAIAPNGDLENSHRARHARAEAAGRVPGRAPRDAPRNSRELSRRRDRPRRLRDRRVRPRSPARDRPGARLLDVPRREQRRRRHRGRGRRDGQRVLRGPHHLDELPDRHAEAGGLGRRRRRLRREDQRRGHRARVCHVPRRYPRRQCLRHRGRRRGQRVRHGQHAVPRVSAHGPDPGQPRRRQRRVRERSSPRPAAVSCSRRTSAAPATTWATASPSTRPACAVYVVGSTARRSTFPRSCRSRRTTSAAPTTALRHQVRRKRWLARLLDVPRQVPATTS